MLLPGGRSGRLQANEAAAARDGRLLRRVLPPLPNCPSTWQPADRRALAAAVAISPARCCFAVPFKQVCACSPVSLCSF